MSAIYSRTIIASIPRDSFVEETAIESTIAITKNIIAKLLKTGASLTYYTTSELCILRRRDNKGKVGSWRMRYGTDYFL